MNFKIISLNLQWWLSVCDPELYRSWPELQSGAGTQRAAGWRVEEGGGWWRVVEGGGCSSCCWGHPGRQLLPLSLSLSLVHSLVLIHCPFYSVSHMHTLTCFRDNGPAEPPASKSGVCHLSSPQRPQRSETLCSSSLTKEPENTSSHVTPICTHAVYLKVELLAVFMSLQQYRVVHCCTKLFRQV